MRRLISDEFLRVIIFRRSMRLVHLIAVVVGMFGSECARVPSEESVDAGSAVRSDSVRFTDVTDRAGLGAFRHVTGARGDFLFPEIMGSGAAFLDYDGDGRLDVLLVGGGHWEEAAPRRYRSLWLYRNEGDGTFTLRSRAAGLEEVSAYGMGVATADFDNDGDPDVFLTAVGRNVLLRNDGGRFVDVTAKAGLADRKRWSTAAVFFDANRDGWLDLYVGNYVRWSPEDDRRCTIDGSIRGYCTPEIYRGVAGEFYLGNGDGTFTERTDEVGMSTEVGKTLGAVELDYDADGWPDLAVANDRARNLLFRNDGDGTFTEVGLRSGLAYGEDGRARAGMGIAAGDADNDGSESVFVGNFTGETIGVFEHRGEGLFLDRASVSGISLETTPTLTFGLVLVDVELDGDLDLFAVNGHIKPRIGEVEPWTSFEQAPQLFVNRGNDRFRSIAGDRGVWDTRLVGRGGAAGDYDRDGDSDLLVTENGGSVRLWRNDSVRGHFLRVRLEGTRSNRDAVGARLKLFTRHRDRAAAVEEGDGVEAIRRRVRGGGSYLSQSERTVTFGLGSGTRVDSLVVRWPSGTVSRTRDPEVDREIRIRESSPRAEHVPSRSGTISLAPD